VNSLLLNLRSWYFWMSVFLAVVGPNQKQAKAQPPGREPAAIPADQFVKLFTLIKPQPGELRFHEIPWLIDVWEARKKAAAEGKPIFVWSGAGGAPIGVC
jgi:hypothetical protein